MKGLKKRIAVVTSGLIALGTATAAQADGTSYSYYECNYGVCTLITCYVVEDRFRGTTQEICMPDDLGGGLGGF